MNRYRLGKVLAGILAAGLLLTALVPSAIAAPPNWSMTVQNLAPVVKPGNDAGFKVTITNHGPSNISALYLTSNQAAAPKYVSPNPYCATSGLLLCSFGALNAGQSVTVDVIAYTVPAGSATFEVVFQANTNGKTFSDKGGTSRGDTLNGTPTPPLTLNGSADFGGGYVVDSTTVANSTTLNRRTNIQSTALAVPSTLIPATVEDGITTDLCTAGGCTGRQLGEWSRVNVADGTTFGAPFRVTITILGRALPNPSPDEDLVFVYHADDAGVPTVIGDTAAERCASADAPGTVPADGCVIAAYSGQDLVISVWVYENGGFKGAY